MSKEKQIEEMGKHCPFYEKGKCILLEEKEVECDMNCDLCDFAKSLYKAGYRKQSEGEWETIPDYQPNKLIAYRHICSVCKTTYKDIRPHGHKFCPSCGAKMKGGAE